MTSETLEIDGTPFTGVRLRTEHTTLLLIQGKKANLGCAYFSLGPADKLGDRFAIVTGVKSFDEMLEARVVAVSNTAALCGVKPEMTGREALLRMERN
ncbi:hypothetical protein SDC9_110973 [bioreactor metagenome]|uniref:DUF1805 domain-containing protein n=1 Tax=bioreactor metagenome TaxID=1076179 RepID=A0A645BFI1_9ZZZZ